MIALQAIWAVVKNPKNLAIIVLLALAVYFAYSKYNLQITYQKDIIAQKDAQLLMAENNQKAINDMTIALKKNALEANKISEQIKPLKEGKAHEKEYYAIANRIADRFNSSLQ